MSTTILFLIVIYNNPEECVSFVDHARDVFGEDAHFAICDNSPTSHQDAFTAIPFVHRPDNPGYLDGALAAYSQVKDHSATWVALTNTDITFSPSTSLASLEGYSADSLILAPRITEGVRKIEKNPYLLQPRGRLRLTMNHFMTANTALAVLYLVLSAGMQKVRAQKPQAASPGQEDTAMFAPYGAVVIFSHDVWANGLVPARVPLLAEEWAIGYMADKNSIPILYAPKFHVLHDPHQTTGPRVSRRRAQMLSKAFAYIHRSSK